VRREDTRWLLELDSAGRDQAVLQAALATGAVRDFHRDLPTLLDIFREAMTEVRVGATA